MVRTLKATTRTDEHVGEWQVTISADTLDALFAEIARAIARTGGPARGDYADWEAISLSAPDTATLAVDWANELIGRSEIHHRIYDDVRIARLDDSTLTADVRGRAAVMWRSPLKAATYHRLNLAHEDGRWRLTMLLDV